MKSEVRNIKMDSSKKYGVISLTNYPLHSTMQSKYLGGGAHILVYAREQKRIILKAKSIQIYKRFNGEKGIT